MRVLRVVVVVLGVARPERHGVCRLSLGRALNGQAELTQRSIVEVRTRNMATGVR